MPPSRSRSVLIVGGGTEGAGIGRLLAEDLEVGAIDLYASPSVSAIADAQRLPFIDSSFEGLWIQSVLEHVIDPWKVVAEIERVLVPDGVVFAESSFLEPVHEGPYDFFRFTPSGHRWLFRRFEELASDCPQGPIFSLSSAVEYVVRGLTRSRFLGKMAKALIVPVLRIVERWIDQSAAADAAALVSFLGVKRGRPMSLNEIVSYYKGSDSAR